MKGDLIRDRISRLEDNIRKDLELLSAYEDEERLTRDPRFLAKVHQEIKRQQDKVTLRWREYNELQDQLAPRQKEHLQGLLRLNEAELAKLNSIGVPSLPANFLPRSEDLEVIKRALMVEECKTTAITGASSIGLHGMGGIGKSVLAAAVARDEEIRRHFPDGILWLNIGTGPKITRRQSDLAGMLDGKPHLFEDSIQGQTVLSILLADKACLIVLDDVWHAGDVWVLLSDVGPGNRILITTRDASIITALGGREYTLELLSDTQSRELLARCSGTAVDVFPTEADEIIRQCGNLPLALALCGAQVRDGVPDVDLLDALKDADLQFIDHEQGSGMKSMKVSVNNLSPRDAKCYGELAFIPPDEAIPEEAILTLWAYSDGLNGRRGRKLLTMLDRKALLRRKGTAQIELHDLQHDFLREICNDV